MKRAILLLAVLIIFLIQSAWATEELTGTWQYKGGDGVIVDYAFASDGKGTVVATTSKGDKLVCQFKYAPRDVGAKQCLYTLVEIPDKKVRMVEVSEITFLSKDKIQTQEINTYVIEKKDISFKKILNPEPEEQPKILEKVND